MEEEKVAKEEPVVKKTTRNSNLLLIVLVVIVIVLVGLAIFIANPNSLPGNSTQVAKVAQTTLTLTKPVPFNNNGKTSYILGVNIDAGDNKVTAVELSVAFDPKVLQNVDVKPSSFFTNPTVLLKKVDTQNGILTYSLVKDSKSTPSVHKGSLAFITFDEISGASGKTTLKFTPKTIVTAAGVAQSVLKQGTGMVFTLNSSK